MLLKTYNNILKNNTKGGKIIFPPFFLGIKLPTTLKVDNPVKKKLAIYCELFYKIII